MQKKGGGFMTDLTAIGEILIDLTQTGVSPEGICSFAANPGGAPANVAVAAARLGASTAFIGTVGRDNFGAILRSTLAHDRVDCSGLLDCPAATTLAVVSVDGQGERSFSFLRGADCALEPGQVDTAKIENSKFLHFGSVSLTAEPARSATLFAVQHAREQGVPVSYDPNYRAALWPSQEEAVYWMTQPLPMVDVLKLSDEELPLLTGTEDPEQGSRILEEMGISLIFITMGQQGAFLRWQGQTAHVPGVPVTVADTNGAGDTFLGAVLRCLTARKSAPLEELTLEELLPITRFANHAAALTCSRSGAIPAMPTLDELAHLIP